MKPFSKVLQAINAGMWAITEEALKGILCIASRDITKAEYDVFHAAKEEDNKALVANLGEPVADTRNAYTKDNIGFLYVDGPIIPRADFFSEISGMVSIETLSRELETLQSMDNVEQIIMVMDTPGGDVTGVSEFAQKIKASEKPVIAYAYGMAASAGYWIASAAKEIHIPDTGLVGSIGVVTTYVDTSKKDADNGIEYIEFVSSQSPQKRPDLGTDEGKSEVQKRVDSLASVFVETVANNRGVSVEKVLSDFGQGGVLIGADAVQAGMADSVTTLDKLIAQKTKTKTILNNNTTISTTNEERIMPGDKKTPLTAAQVRENHPEQVAEIEKSAVHAERTRISEIEAVSASISNMGPVAVAAANKTINTMKMQDGQTAATVAVAVLGAVNEASAKQKNEVIDAGHRAADLAEKVPTPTPKNDGDADKAGLSEKRKKNIAANL